jgi:hypothetical protein
MLRIKGEKRKVYFDMVHELWDKHVFETIPFQYFNNKFERVSKNEHYSFVTIDPKRINSGTE